MERETGIEPATNSLEGCDSTTELLPPSRLSSAAPQPFESRISKTESQQRVVARGGFEPPKPLGRQIYSLLRLTASLPRQLSVCWSALLSVLTLRTGGPIPWSWRMDLNPRPADYKSAALPD